MGDTGFQVTVNLNQGIALYKREQDLIEPEVREKYKLFKQIKKWEKSLDLKRKAQLGALLSLDDDDYLEAALLPLKSVQDTEKEEKRITYSDIVKKTSKKEETWADEVEKEFKQFMNVHNKNSGEEQKVNDARKELKKLCEKHNKNFDSYLTRLTMNKGLPNQKLCRNIAYPIGCENGGDCSFAHSKEEMCDFNDAKKAAATYRQWWIENNWDISADDYEYYDEDEFVD